MMNKTSGFFIVMIKIRTHPDIFIYMYIYHQVVLTAWNSLNLSYHPSQSSIARGVIVIVVGNGHGDTSSNPGRD